MVVKQLSQVRVTLLLLLSDADAASLGSCGLSELDFFSGGGEAAHVGRVEGLERVEKLALENNSEVDKINKY